MPDNEAPTSDLTGWERAPFTAAEQTYDCFEKGSGPGVVLVPEIPGITPEVLGLADHLVDQGFTVVIPSPFGTPGRPTGTGYIARVLAARTPGPGVGVIGMCFTGGFALAAAVDDVVLAPVLSQPSLPLPLPLSAARRRDPGVSPQELACVVARTTTSDLSLLGLRFTQDPVVPADRFATLREHLGEAFEVIELDSSPGNAAGFGRSAHAVLTVEVREQPGHPALAARQRMVDFLRERLAPAPRPAADEVTGG
jgi:dienelactone hydrolase